jgi:hypothetical protein
MRLNATYLIFERDMKLPLPGSRPGMLLQDRRMELWDDRLLCLED